MGTQRSGIGGTVQEEVIASITVPNITDGDSADVALPANAAFIGAVTGRRVDAGFAAAPLANLGILGAWISNGTTGVVTVRLCALTGNVATAAQSVWASAPS